MFDGASRPFEGGARSAPGASTGPGPIFLHAGWRCGSTYLWNKFRQAAGTTCFYEPFNEQLRHLTPARIRRNKADAWSSRHPPLDRPYYAEYADVLTWRGVRGFSERFALERYFPAQDGTAEEVSYLERLASIGRHNRTALVFGFSRSLARVRPLREAFGGVHIVVRRDPVQQWLSCRSYRVGEGSDYFEACHFLILALAPPGSEAAEIAGRLGIPRPPVDGVKRQLRWLRSSFGAWSDELSYRVFRTVHALSYLKAEAHADVVFDVDDLTRSLPHRLAMQGTLARHTHLGVDLSDCRTPRRDTSRLPVDFAAIDRAVETDLGIESSQPCTRSRACAGA